MLFILCKFVVIALVALRRRSHYGGNDGGGSGHGDGYVMWRVGHTVNIPKGYCKERENGGHRSLEDLPFFFVSAWWQLRQSQESTSQDHVCSSPPAMSAEESRIAVTAVFRAGAPGSTPFPGYNPFSSSPTTVLGSAKTTWLLGKRCLRDVAKDGTKISRLGGEPILTTFSHVQRYLLVSIPDVWQVLGERNHSSKASTASSEETSHCVALASSG